MKPIQCTMNPCGNLDTPWTNCEIMIASVFGSMNFDPFCEGPGRATLWATLNYKQITQFIIAFGGKDGSMAYASIGTRKELFGAERV